MKHLDEFKTQAMQWMSRTGLKLEKKSPEILMACSLVGFGLTIVTACRATLHAEEVIDRHNRRMEQAKQAAEVAEPGDHYDLQKEKVAVWSHTVIDMGGLYALPAALGALTIFSAWKARNILNNRYLGAVAAYNAISEVFQTYRNRVIDKEGVEADRYYRYGGEWKTLETVETREDGTTEVSTEKAEYMNDPILPSEFARYFDCDNPNWDENANFNLMFLRAQQKAAQLMYDKKGHLLLNEVYDLLGYKDTPIGAVAGWVKGEGQDTIDFGLYDGDDPRVRRFVNGAENVILLDFNVCGIVWDKI